jgi:hypothetical protein
MVTLLSTVQGNKPQEQTEYLLFSCNGKNRYMTAYNKGNGYIKLFSLQEYINFYYLQKAYHSVDISLDLYNDDKAFEDFIKETFFVKKSNF